LEGLPGSCLRGLRRYRILRGMTPLMKQEVVESARVALSLATTTTPDHLFDQLADSLEPFWTVDRDNDDSGLWMVDVQLRHIPGADAMDRSGYIREALGILYDLCDVEGWLPEAEREEVEMASLYFFYGTGPGTLQALGVELGDWPENQEFGSPSVR
jgi:hypothetical protein